MAVHIHIHRGAARDKRAKAWAAKDAEEPKVINGGPQANTQYVENWGSKLIAGKTYKSASTGRKYKAIKASFGGTNGRTPLMLIKWLDEAAKDESALKKSLTAELEGLRKKLAKLKSVKSFPSEIDALENKMYINAAVDRIQTLERRLKTMDAYRGSWTTEVEPEEFRRLKVGQALTWKGAKVKVVSKHINNAKKTASGEMIPQKAMVTFETVDGHDTIDARQLVPGKKYRSSRGIVTYIGPDKNGRHGDILVKTASGFVVKMHEDDLGEEFSR